MNMRRLQSSAADFATQLQALTAWDAALDEAVVASVTTILRDVKQNGDSAVLKYTQQFDHSTAANIAQLKIPAERFTQALQNISVEQRHALETAAARIRQYAEHQTLQSWSFVEADGTVLGQQVTALDRVGLYVPGGKAAYPSSVLMNAIPAKVAGVRELVMVVPAPQGQLNDLVLAAAKIAGVDTAFTIGGAQAIAALAYGTQSIAAVDKIVGPGNAYVATAKRLVFGTVGIDMVAGPSEIVIVCDGKTDPDWIAMDLFSQAEHDESAQSILISSDATFLDKVDASIQRLIQDMPRAQIIKQSLSRRGAFIHVRDLTDAIDVVNYIAPEHLELSVDEPQHWAAKVRHAGAIFLGRHTPEALGDYCAGPNHVLPTSRTARFASPLGVYDFQKRSSIIHCSVEGAAQLAKTAAVLAHGEGLVAHARSAEYRLKTS
ncbi:MAG: histidinol dehydrogenase [Gammaproteobacteria bacterium]|nr:histidinol dehydrogenase [Gammaproteobacteria bacterium]